MAALTEWEIRHLTTIETLIGEIEEQVNTIDSSSSDALSTVWILFRYTVLNMYSVLDYVWYFLYCHFCNKGVPDHSDAITTLNFPCKPKGVKIVVSEENHSHDQRNKFKAEKTKMILKDTPVNLWVGDAVGDLVFELQPKVEVDTSGVPVHTCMIRKPQPGSAEESFMMLHYYRNCVTHRELIHFANKTMYVELNKSTREMKIVESSQGDKSKYTYLDIKEGLWIRLPERLVDTVDHGLRPLIEVLDQLKGFVLQTTCKLLYLSHIVSAKALILHMSNVQLQTYSCQQCPQGTVVKLMLDKGCAIEKRSINEEASCVEVLMELIQKPEYKYVPPTPFKYFQLQCKLPRKPTVRIETKGKTCLSMMNELKQQLENNHHTKIGWEMSSKVSQNAAILHEVEGQLIADLWKLRESAEAKSISEAKESASKKVLAELIRLGFAELIVPISTLEQSSSFGFHKTLEWFKDSTSGSLIVDYDYKSGYDDSESVHHYHIKATITAQQFIELCQSGFNATSFVINGLGSDVEAASKSLICRLQAMGMIGTPQNMFDHPRIDLDKGRKNSLQLLNECIQKLQSKGFEIDKAGDEPQEIVPQKFTAKLVLKICDACKKTILFEHNGNEETGSSKQEAKLKAADMAISSLSASNWVYLK